MNYRHAEILASQDLGEAGTEPIDIKIVDPISRITIIFRPIGGSDTAVAHPVSCITKLELVDGSDVHYSLSGYEAHALNIMEAKVPVLTHLDYRTGGTPYIVLNMDFGRKLWDPEYAYDPKRFKNPQLRLTWDEDLWDGSCDSHSFKIYGHIFDEKAITPVGFLVNKEIKSYTGVASSYEYTNIPTDYILRKLILQGFEQGQTVRSTIEDIRLSEDNDKRIPIDGDIYDLRSFLDVMSGECVDQIVMRATVAGNRVYCTPGQFYDVQAETSAKANYLGVAGIAGNTFVVESQSASVVARCTVKGKNPHNCICIPFGNQDDPGDWYDVTKLGSLKLRINGGGRAANGETNIITQQLRTY